MPSWPGFAAYAAPARIRPALTKGLPGVILRERRSGHPVTDTARRVLEWLGIRTDRPLVTQVSRFDPWKDPLGVIQAYRKVREEVSDLQLVMAGSLALDDPEGWQVYRAIRTETAGDPSMR